MLGPSTRCLPEGTLSEIMWMLGFSRDFRRLGLLKKSKDSKGCKGCPKIHARFEFGAICAVKYCERKTNDSVTTESLGLLKMEGYKFQQKSAYVPAKPWRPFTRYAIPYITLYCLLYESIKNLQFVIIKLCFLSELLLA